MKAEHFAGRHQKLTKGFEDSMFAGGDQNYYSVKSVLFVKIERFRCSLNSNRPQTMRDWNRLEQRISKKKTFGSLSICQAVKMCPDDNRPKEMALRNDAGRKPARRNTARRAQPGKNNAGLPKTPSKSNEQENTSPTTQPRT
jgi:hypothetical protein